jgi:tetratricopeptide (TPR) repeat protein
MIGLLLLLSVPVTAPAQCDGLYHHGKLQQTQACYASLLSAGDPFIRAQAYVGLGKFQEANNEFRTAYKAQPSAPIATEWAKMFMQRDHPEEAEPLLREAIKADERYAPAYLELARLAGDSFSKDAIKMAQHALDIDPKLYQAHEYLAYLALEDDNPKLSAEEAQKALAISNEALDAMAVLASEDWLHDKPQSEWMSRILSIDPAYGEAYATGAHFFEINRRYAQAIEWYRKALSLNENLLETRSQLALNLMRIGQDNEAKKQFVICYSANFRDKQTVNALKLLDTLPQYQTFKTPTTELLLNKKEAELLRPYFEAEMRRAMATYDRKYKMHLPGPLRVEVYPNHEDFVVKSLGLPGQEGLLGVTFGLVIAMDSPSARAAGEFSWASTLWHEMSHAYILTATNHLVPRWFTEGLSVHEEGAASSKWGDRMTPEVVSAMQKKQLLPVLDLDKGFVRPAYPTQVLVSYFQAGKMLDFIAQKWGDDAIVGMVHSYGAKKTTAQAITDNLHVTPEAFDQQFAAWLDQQTASTVRHFDEWKKGMKQMQTVAQATALRDEYPEYVGGGSAYKFLFDAYSAKADTAAALREGERYRDLGGTDVELLEKLANLELHTAPAQAAATLQDINFIHPEDEKVHQQLAALLLEKGDASGAVRESQALIALKPGDTAEAQFELARALQAANRPDEARDHVLQALEAAPNFKPAQQLLLQLTH